MNRKFKMAGALMAVVAMFALTASSASATFTSTVSPNSATGTSTGDVFDLFGSTDTCTENTFHVGKFNSTAEPGKHVEATFPTNTLTVVPTYNKCTAFGLPDTTNFTGCDYVFHSEGAHPLYTNIITDLVCPPNVEGVDTTIYSSAAHTTALCHVVVTPFTGKGGLTASNNGNHILITGTLVGITAHQNRTSVFCPAGTETKEAKYTVQAAGITIKSNTGGALSVS